MGILPQTWVSLPVSKQYLPVMVPFQTLSIPTMICGFKEAVVDLESSKMRFYSNRANILRVIYAAQMNNIGIEKDAFGSDELG